MALAAVTASYATVAMLLAMLALFGVLAHGVNRRKHEMGLRIVVGASRRDLLLLVIREGLGLTLFGIGAGMMVSSVLMRATASILFGVSTLDPVVYVSISAILLGVASLACYLPARDAMRLDPIIALRHE